MAQDAATKAAATVDRAERLVEQAADGGLRFLVRTFARAREEAQDIWAEAKSVKRPDQP